MVHRKKCEFDAVNVGRCHVQTAKDRYDIYPNASVENVTGQVDTDTDYDDDDQDGFFFQGEVGENDNETDASQDHHEDVASSDLPSGSEYPEFDPNFRPALQLGPRGMPIPPRMALWRMNLTALSQRYNLYFVAYEGDVYVYRPRDAIRNTLPSLPDYVLRSKPIGPNFAGHILERRGHQVNNMVVGDLGDDEVLALAFDNGNVIAYNVKLVANHIAALERDPRSWAGRMPRPFFHQSVAISAWGLALHKKSRLIAVSCNYRTITVFYPALCAAPSSPRSRNGGDGDGDGDDNDSDFPNVRGPDYSLPELHTPQRGHSTLKDNSHRRRNYRVTFFPTQEASNIPSVAFTSLADGTADKVAGIDIGGIIWVFDVWGEKSPVAEIPYNHICSDERNYCRGWGLLFLPSSSFLPVSDLKEAFGARTESQIVPLWGDRTIGFDVSPTLHNIPDSLLSPRSVVPIVGPDTSSDGSDDGGGNNDNDNDPPLPLPATHPLSSPEVRFGRSPKRPGHPFSLWASNRDSRGVNQYSVFRVGIHKMELHNLKPDSEGALSIGVLRPSFQANDPRYNIWLQEDRMNKLAHIPELSLVVVGSIWGHVALVRLTQTPPIDPQRGFRVEWTLPRRSDATSRALAPLFPFEGQRRFWYLHGLATSPIPESRPHSQSYLPHRRFRLILHYRNHTIISYELSRDPETEELLVA